MILTTFQNTPAHGHVSICSSCLPLESSEVQNKRETEQKNYYKNGELGSSDDKKDFANPIFDVYVFLESERPSGILKMTNFSPDKLSNLFLECSEFIKNEWSSGLGKRTKYAMCDIL